MTFATGYEGTDDKRAIRVKNLIKELADKVDERYEGLSSDYPTILIPEEEFGDEEDKRGLLGLLASEIFTREVPTERGSRWEMYRCLEVIEGIDNPRYKLKIDVIDIKNAGIK